MHTDYLHSANVEISVSVDSCGMNSHIERVYLCSIESSDPLD